MLGAIILPLHCKLDAHKLFNIIKGRLSTNTKKYNVESFHIDSSALSKKGSGFAIETPIKSKINEKHIEKINPCLNTIRPSLNSLAPK